MLTPFEVLVHGGDAGAVARAATAVAGRTAAVAPAGAAWHRAGTAIVAVLPSADGQLPGRARHASDASGRPCTRSPGASRVGGRPRRGKDFVDAIYGSFPLMFALIVAVTFVLLARAFRSILLPLKAVALNLISVGGRLRPDHPGLAGRTRLER